MRLKRVSIRALFGSFDHDIEFPNDSPVVLVHGPNGFGKTVILRMIEAYVRGDVSIFMSTPFTEFTLLLDDNSQFVVTRTVPLAENAVAVLTFAKVTADGMRISEDGGPLDPPKDVLDFIDAHVPRWGRWRNGWRDSLGNFRTLSEVLETFPGIRQKVPKSFSKYFVSHAIEGLNVYFVRTERLSASEDSATRPVSRTSGEYVFEYDPNTLEAARAARQELRVEQYSAAIVRLIQSVLAGYAKRSQESDRTFPERLVRFLRSRDEALTEREILAEMAVLEEKRQRLISLGFLDRESGLSDITEDDIQRAREALTIYVRDVREKFEVFDDLALRIGMLTDIANERLRFKRLTIDRERGFQVAGDAAGSISLGNLSSGEQHELVLLYELLFKVSRNDLVLIDEPEISLHVAWQSRFLKDLLGILQLTDAYAIVATHSPTIIGARWDLAVQLRGPEPEETESDARIL